MHKIFLIEFPDYSRRVEVLINCFQGFEVINMDNICGLSI